MPTTNPFPLNILEKTNSPDLLAFLQQFGKEHYLDADDINLIVTAINYLHENMSSGGGGSDTNATYHNRIIMYFLEGSPELSYTLEHWEVYLQVYNEFFKVVVIYNYVILYGGEEIHLYNTFYYNNNIIAFISNNIKGIGNNDVFYNCSNLEQVVLENARYNSTTFTGCSNLLHLDFGKLELLESYLPHSLRSLKVPNQNKNSIFIEDLILNNPTVQITYTLNKSADIVLSATDIPTIEQSQVNGLTTDLSNKVDKITGKGLSTEDYTSTEKTKLEGIETGAQVNPDLSVYELASKKQNSLAIDGAGIKYPTVDAVNSELFKLRNEMFINAIIYG